jgi:hypothetical protein
MARIEALGSSTKHSSSSLCCKTTCRTSHDFQTMRQEIRERLGERMVSIEGVGTDKPPAMVKHSATRRKMSRPIECIAVP